LPWDQDHFNEYMRIVRTANSHYERFKKSRIHTFTGLLKMKRFRNDPGHLRAIQDAWNAAPEDARRQYNSAWLYVQGELFPAPPVIARGPAPRGGVALPGLGGVGSVAVVRAVQREVRVALQDEVCTEALAQTLNGRRYDWTVRFRIRLVRAGRQSQSLSVIVKFAAYSGNGDEFAGARRRREVGDIPVTHEGATLTDEVKRNWSTRITERWNGAVFAVQDSEGDDLDRYDIDFNFEWAAPDEDATNLHKIYAVRTTDVASPPDGTIDTSFWGVNDGGTTGAAIAHEFGHLIGNPDEYGACVFKGRNNARDRDCIMDNETTGRSKAGHFWLIGKHAATLLGADPARCVVRLNAVNYRVSNDHPWG